MIIQTKEEQSKKIFDNLHKKILGKRNSLLTRSITLFLFFLLPALTVIFLILSIRSFLG